MAYIQPNTDIYLLEGVPVDPDYEHTIYFPLSISGQPAPFTSDNYALATKQDIVASRREQANWFLDAHNYPHFVFTNQTYQRVNNGVIRVHKNAENLLRVNYLVFRNTNYQDTTESVLNERWFYAFVTKIDYINNEVAQVHYFIDVMQTWWFDYVPNTCYVEREHSITDELFSNIVEEDLEVGDEYVCNNQVTFDMNEQVVVILTNRKLSGGAPASASICANNIYTPVRVNGSIYPTHIALLDTLLDSYNENDIISIYQCPKFLCPEVPTAGSVIDPATASMTVPENLTTINGYTPKNKKLFCYPYNCIVASNNCGEVQTYRWEDWQGQRGNFEIKGVFITMPVVTCYPVLYRGMNQDYDQAISYSNFPMCAWGGDTFKNWWTTNKNSFITGAITNAANSALFYKKAAQIGTADVETHLPLPLGEGDISRELVSNFNGMPVYSSSMSAIGGARILSGIMQSVANYNDIKNAPSRTHGQIKFDSLNSGINRVRFDFYCMSIKAQYARIIDEFFTRYGYACKRIKEPNRIARREWCFTKTMGCTLGKANLPAEAEKDICAIYDKGITFWINPAHIGDYTLDNSPITGG